MPKVAQATVAPAFQRLRRQQDDVLSRPQLRELEVSRHVLRRRLKAKAWQEVGPHVVVLHCGPLSRPQRLWVALLHGGRGAALGGLTAAEADGLVGFESPALLVLVPHGSSRAGLELDQIKVKVRESRHLGEDDVHPMRTPRRTRLPRSIIDGASIAGTDGRCRAIIAAAVQQRWVRTAELRACAAGRPTLPRRALILETIGDVEGGSQSLPELQYLHGLRRAGLPTPTRQRLARHADGFHYLDADFEPFQVTVEINGVQHIDLLHKEADDIRRTRLAIGGRLIVDLGSYTVRRNIGLAVLLTAEALMSRGWQPTPEVRRRLQRMVAATGEHGRAALSA